MSAPNGPAIVLPRDRKRELQRTEETTSHNRVYEDLTNARRHINGRDERVAVMPSGREGSDLTATGHNFALGRARNGVPNTSLHADGYRRDFEGRRAVILFEIMWGSGMTVSKHNDADYVSVD
jgi:hypothetical protein